MDIQQGATTASGGEAAISEISFRQYRIPFKREFSTSRGASRFRYGAVVFVSLVDGSATGIGELAPLPLSHPETVSRALRAGHWAASRLIGRTPNQALDWIGRFTGQEPGREWMGQIVPASLLCGIEMALLDALGAGAGGTPLAALLQSADRAGAAVSPGSWAYRPEISVNAVIGAGDVAESVRRAEAAVAAGFSCLKLKVGLDPDRAERDVELVRAVREGIGPGIELRLDANGAWNLLQASAVLSGCVHYDIAYVEQPLPVTGLAELPALRRRTGVRIALDEAVVDLAAARRILRARLADVLVIKPQAVGGLVVSRRIVEEAAALGVDCVLTSSIESGIGTAATLQLAAALPQLRLACGLATLPLLAEDLIVEELTQRSGAIRVPDGSGLGVTLDEPALERYSSGLP